MGLLYLYSPLNASLYKLYDSVQNSFSGVSECVCVCVCVMQLAGQYSIATLQLSSSEASQTFIMPDC